MKASIEMVRWNNRSYHLTVKFFFSLPLQSVFIFLFLVKNEVAAAEIVVEIIDYRLSYLLFEALLSS